MTQSLNQGEKTLTIDKIERRAAKLRTLYKKRLKGQPGRRPDKAFFILSAAYSINEELPPEKRMSQKKLSDWLEEKFPQYDPDGKCSWFQLKNLYRMKKSGPFKNMEYQKVWDDLKTVYEISCNGASRENRRMSQRDIMRAYSISKQELENMTGFILSVNAGNKKTSNKFIFDRPA